MDRVQMSQVCRGNTSRQFTFNHWVPRSSWDSFDPPRKGKRPSQTWSHLLVFNPGTGNSEFQLLGYCSIILIVAGDRVNKTFNTYRATQAIGLDTTDTRMYLRGLGLLISFIDSRLKKFLVRFSSWILHVLVIRSFVQFWTKSFQNNIQLMLEVVKVPISALFFFYYPLMIVLMMLFAILLPMLFILLFILNFFKHLICDGSFSWLWNLNLTFKKLSIGVEFDLLVLILRTCQNNCQLPVKVNQKLYLAS